MDESQSVTEPKPSAAGDLVERLVEFTRQHQGCGVSVILNDGEWSVMMEWGWEAEDSPMVGAAAHGIGDTFEAALTQALGEAGA